jgi:hypothetical protein
MKVIKSRDLGERELVDIEVDNPCHNFILSNGLVASNSHSIAYSALTAITIYLKYKFPYSIFPWKSKNDQQQRRATIRSWNDPKRNGWGKYRIASPSYWEKQD